MDAGRDFRPDGRADPALPGNACAARAAAERIAMRAPHPDLNELYRRAGAPTTLLERERRQVELVGIFEVDLDAAGMSGEALLAPLTDPVLLDAPLEQALLRLDEAGPASEEFQAGPPRPRFSN